MAVTVTACTSTSVTRPLDGFWDILVRAATVPTVTITPPDGVVVGPDPMAAAAGSYSTRWLTSVELDQPGRWVAHVVADDGAIDFTVWVGTIVPASGIPDRDALDLYMGEHSYTDADLDDALAAEAAAQRGVCRIPADYSADLANALLRRAQRNLFMRRLPLALPAGDADTGPQVLPANDPEVRRFERPYRKMGIG